MIQKKALILFVVLQITMLGSTILGQKSLKELTAENQKIFLMVSNPDSVSNLYETSFDYLQRNGYWKISDNINDADFVLLLTGFNIKLNGYPHFECYPKIYDKEMNFIYRGDFLWKSGTIWDTHEILFDRTIRSRINALPKELASAKPSKTSIYEIKKKNEKGKKLSDKAKKTFDEYIEQANEAIKYKQSSKAIDYLSKCIKISPTRYDLYKLRSFFYLEMNNGKGAMNDLKIYIENTPTDIDTDIYWQTARYQRSERNERIMKTWEAIGMGFQIAGEGLAQMNATNAKVNANKTANRVVVATPTSNAPQTPAKKLGCTVCNSAMENSNFNYRTMIGDGKCWNCTSGGQKKSCLGISKRGIPNFGTKCTEEDCANNGHKCGDCKGTNICPKCNGKGYSE